jgi:hypothetical protein
MNYPPSECYDGEESEFLDHQSVLRWAMMKGVPDLHLRGMTIVFQDDVHDDPVVERL